MGEIGIFSALRAACMKTDARPNSYIAHQTTNGYTLNGIVRYLYLTFATRENLRRLLAAVFLVFLLAEWGSHGVICSGSSSTDEQSLSASQDGDEDPCQTLVLCSDGKNKDQQTTNLGHDASQHNGLFDHLSDIRPLNGSSLDPQLPFAAAYRIFRPPSPPFHPPELA